MYNSRNDFGGQDGGDNRTVIAVNVCHLEVGIRWVGETNARKDDEGPGNIEETCY